MTFEQRDRQIDGLKVALVTTQFELEALSELMTASARIPDYLFERHLVVSGMVDKMKVRIEELESERSVP